MIQFPSNLFIKDEQKVILLFGKMENMQQEFKKYNKNLNKKSFIAFFELPQVYFSNEGILLEVVLKFI